MIRAAAALSNSKNGELIVAFTHLRDYDTRERVYAGPRIASAAGRIIHGNMALGTHSALLSSFAQTANRFGCFSFRLDSKAKSLRRGRSQDRDLMLGWCRVFSE